MDSPNSPDFAFTSSTKHHNNNIFRSHSTKESPFTNFLNSPSHLSCPTLSRSLQNSPISSPHHHYFPTKISDSDHPKTTYHCASSVLRNDGQIMSIALSLSSSSSSSGLLYTGSDSNLVRVWKLPEFTECGQLRTKASKIVAIEVSNDTVYAAYGDGKIRMWTMIWDTNHKVLKHVRSATIPKTLGYVRSYIAGKDKTMKHKRVITSIAINTAEDILYTASLDKTVKLWQISDMKCIETIKAHNEPINDIIVSDDGVLYTASDDASVRVWRRNFCSHDQPHSLTVTLHAKFSPVKALTLTNDGGILYGGCTDGYIHYWLKGWFVGQLQYGGSIQGHTHAVLCLASVGKYVVSGSADSTSRVWSREQDGQQHVCLAVLVGHRGPIRCVTAFLGGSNLLDDDNEEDSCNVCTGSLDGVLKLWRVTHTKNVHDHNSNNTMCLSQPENKYFDFYKGFQ